MPPRRPSGGAVVPAPCRATTRTRLDAGRARPAVGLPASRRAGLYLQRAAQALALFDERDFVLPDDVKTLVLPVLSHRLGMRGHFLQRQDDRLGVS